MIVGVLGGGQLARMLAQAGHDLGLKVVFIDPATDACAGPVAEQLHGDFDDQTLLAKLADIADVVTYEFENVPDASIEFLAGRVPVYPSAQALSTAQDRLVEKSLFKELGIQTAEFARVDSVEDLQAAIGHIGLPAILKTRRFGYDGKGQVMLRSKEQLATAWEEIGKVPAIVEAFVPFTREVSVIAVRDRDGQTRFYPLSENTHRNGILHLSICRANDPLQQQAEQYAQRLLDRLEYTGVVALELFVVGDHLLANEFAPRVHNSGHWTTEGAETSQFENHMRAVAGLPLGETTPVDFTAMINCIGDMPDIAKLLAIPNAHVHAYGKAAREGRKVGHVTLRANDSASLEQLCAQVIKLIE